MARRRNTPPPPPSILSRFATSCAFNAGKLLGSPAALTAIIAILIALAGLVSLPTDVTFLRNTLDHPPSIKSFTQVDVFINRSGVIEQIVDTLNGGKSFVLIEGEHRVGKSLLVNRLAHELAASRTILVMDCPEPISVEAIIEELFQFGRPEGIVETVSSQLKLPLR